MILIYLWLFFKIDEKCFFKKNKKLFKLLLLLANKVLYLHFFCNEGYLNTSDILFLTKSQTCMGTKYLLRNEISNKNKRKRSNILKTENKNVQSFQTNVDTSLLKDDKLNYKNNFTTSKNPNYEDFVFLYSSVEGRFLSIF